MSLLAGRKGHDWNQLQCNVSGFLALKTFFPAKFVDCDSWREHTDNHPDYPGTPGNKSEHIHHPHLLGVVEATGAKLPRLHQRFLVKKYVAQQNFCSRVLLPSFAPSYQTGLILGSKPQEQICCTASSLVCTEICNLVPRVLSLPRGRERTLGTRLLKLAFACSEFWLGLSH